MADALRDSTPVLEAVRRAGINRADLNSISFDDLRPNTVFDGSRSTSASISESKEYYAMLNIVRMLGDEWAVKNTDNIERLVYDSASSSVRICSLKKDRIPENTALLILDATADQSLVEKVTGPVKFEQIDIEQRAVVTQVYDHTGSNRWRNDYPGQVDQLVSVLNEWVRYGEKPLCVSHKNLADNLKLREDLNEQVKVLNFGGLRGSNDAENCSVVFITGRNQLPLPAIDQKARALFWDEEEGLKHDDLTTYLPKELRGYLLSERYVGSQSGVQVRSFSDPRIEKMHAQEREAETTQAIARLRLVYSPVRRHIKWNIRAV